MHCTSPPRLEHAHQRGQRPRASSLTESALRSAVAGDDSAVRALEALFRRVRETNGKPETESSARKPRARGLANADVVASAASAAARVVTSGFERRSSECQSDTLSTPSIVAAFPQSASGDVSPNVLGAFDARARCGVRRLASGARRGSAGRFAKKAARSRLRRARTPGTEGDRFLSCLVTGTRRRPRACRFWTAPRALGSPRRRRALGPDREEAAPRRRAVDEAAAADENGDPGSLRYSFAAGTTDGPGENGFTQGDREHEDDTTEHEKKTKNRARARPRRDVFVRRRVRRFKRVGGERRARALGNPCSWLFATRTKTKPRRGFRSGNVGFVEIRLSGGCSGTCRAGVQNRARVDFVRPGGGDHRRGEEAGTRRRAPRAESDPESRGSGEEQTWSTVVNGLANGYSGYVTTAEEYAAQRHEGASTLYGPNTSKVCTNASSPSSSPSSSPEREDEAEDENWKTKPESSYARAEPSEVYKISENLWLATSPCRVSCLRSTRGGRRARNSGRWFLARTERDTVRPTPERDTTTCVFASAPAATTARRASRFSPEGREDFPRALGTSGPTSSSSSVSTRVYASGTSSRTTTTCPRSRSGRARPSVARQPPDAELAPAGRHEAGDVPRGPSRRSEGRFRARSLLF